jgi:UDP-N-acetylmuramoyl-L-alanyl-D-glutamate--2,6-diaminopimelate ligase
MTSLSKLLCGVEPVRTSGDLQTKISQLCYDSRQVTPGSLFFALPGWQSDGHQFINDALDRGASGVVMQRELPLSEPIAGIVVKDARQVMGVMAKNFYTDPTAGMILVGITGTNGKTTVTYLVESLLKEAGLRPAVIGTVAYRFENQCLEAPHTTPESIDLYRILQQFREAGCNAVVMEVSSHALEQSRVAGLEFDVAVLTNLTPEHLDYHRDMDSYFAAKRRLFNGPVKAVVNLDDPFGIRLARELGDVISVSALQQATVSAADVELSLAGIRASLNLAGVTCRLQSALLGQFNLQNLLCAAGVGIGLGLPGDLITGALAKAERVPGRLEAVPNRFDCQILVDYAHTGDALEKALSALQNLKPSRLLTLFGCGGDRDRSKRPVMGAVAARYSDLVVVTSDNPRTEAPAAILAEIRPGVQQVFAQELNLREAGEADARGFVVIEDRREAIEFAVSLLRAGDVLLVAGKGHEDYQILGRKKIHFDDREELARAISKREQAA